MNRDKLEAWKLEAGDKPWEKLPSWPNMSERMREYVRTIMEGDAEKIRKMYLKSFKDLKDDWSDEIPEQDVRELATLDEKGQFVGDKYKVRGNFIFALKTTIVGAIRNGVLTDLNPKVQEMIDKLSAHEFDSGRRTTREEVDLMNETLDAIIAFLEAPRV